MTARAYTVAEIRALRSAVTSMFLFGEYAPKDAQSCRQLDYAAVEAQIQTHMLAGHTAQDLYESQR